LGTLLFKLTLTDDDDLFKVNIATRKLYSLNSEGTIRYSEHLTDDEQFFVFIFNVVKYSLTQGNSLVTSQ